MAEEGEPTGPVSPQGQNKPPSRPFSPRKKDVVTVLLTDTENAAELLQGVYLAAGKHGDQASKSKVSDPVIGKEALTHSVSDKMFCSYCGQNFLNRKEQKSHYRTDWHRYNLKLKLRGMDSIGQEKFEELAAGDISSISGSEGDSSSEEEEDRNTSKLKEKLPVSKLWLLEKRKLESSDSESEMSAHVEGIGRRHPRVFLHNNKGQLLSIYRCVLHGRKNQPADQEELITMATEMPKQMKWVIFMTAGGHFAGAIFNKDEVIAHKTFHRYTVRAKRGTAQGSRDKQGNAPHSAGASLRRYNESALTEDIAGLIRTWSDHMRSCDRIFLRAPSFNKAMFVGGKNPPLDKKDPRIRLIPFPTRRPTFNELKRVHSALATIDCHGGESSIHDHIYIPSPKRSTRSTNKNQPKEHQTVAPPAACSASASESEDSNKSDGEEYTLVVEEQTISTGDMRSFEVTRKPRRKKNVSTKELPEGAGHHHCLVADPSNTFDAEQSHLRDKLYTACKTGNINTLQRLLAPLLHAAIWQQQEEPENSPKSGRATEGVGGLTASDPSAANEPRNVSKEAEDLICTEVDDEGRGQTPQGPTLEMINKSFGENRRTLLHVAAMAGHAEAVCLLLHAGADPTIGDKRDQPAFLTAADKATRTEFRRFMGKYPDKFDYSIAQIPAPLSSEKEVEKKAKESERKRARRKAKKDRLKEKKAEDAMKVEEEREKERFLKLSDREKRALAAERRLASQLNNAGQATPVLSRCWQCGGDITGKVPFEYYDYKFCTPRCLKDHKLANSARKS